MKQFDVRYAFFQTNSDDLYELKCYPCFYFSRSELTYPNEYKSILFFRCYF